MSAVWSKGYEWQLEISNCILIIFVIAAAQNCNVDGPITPWDDNDDDDGDMALSLMAHVH